jgi:multiple sugar transport system permease protein
LLFAMFTAGPVLASLFMSVTDIRSTDLRNPFAVEFTGFSNYVEVLSDPLFHKVAINTAIFVLVGVPLTMGLALAAAVGLNSITWLRSFFRLGYYLPVVTSIVAVAVVWRFLLQPEGPINALLGTIGIDGPDWLQSTTFALPSLIVMTAWRNLGTLMVIFLAGLQTVPQEMLEAAEVDGAGRWQRFRYVTVPILRPTLLFGAVITGIGYLQFFEEPFVMTQGGPLDATRSMAMYVYDQFGFGNYGFAAAASYVLFVAIVALTVVQFRILQPKD